MAKIKFTSNLNRFFPSLGTLDLAATDVRSIIDQLDEYHEGLSNYLIDENGALRKHVNIYINEQLIQDRKQLSDRVTEESEVFFMQAISGG